MEARRSTGARGKCGPAGGKDRGSRKVWGRGDRGDEGVASGQQDEEGASAEGGGTRVGSAEGTGGEGTAPR